MSADVILVKHLRQAADELDSARRYGLPIPATISVNGYDNIPALSLSFDTLAEFDEWADYASDIEATEYDHEGEHWHRAEGTLGLDGLTVTFAVSLGEPA